MDLLQLAVIMMASGYLEMDMSIKLIHILREKQTSEDMIQEQHQSIYIWEKKMTVDRAGKIRFVI